MIPLRLGTIALCLLVVCGCSKPKQTAHDQEVLEWQRLKNVQFYWEEQRTSRLEAFATALRQMGEPVCWNAPADKLTGHFYRFLWLRTFHSPVVIRITSVAGGRWEVRSRRFTGQAGFSIGELEHEVVVTTSSPDTASLVADLDRWLSCVPEYDGAMGGDGANWFIDGVRDGRYFAVHTWSPEAGWIRETGLRFLKVAKIDEKDIY